MAFPWGVMVTNLLLGRDENGGGSAFQQLERILKLEDNKNIMRLIQSQYVISSWYKNNILFTAYCYSTHNPINNSA